jgi:DNA mismatch repair ATPase MutS
MFLPVAVLMMWDVRTGLTLDSWRAAHGDRIARWLDAVADLEALSSLAGYAFENPADPFPDLLTGPPALTADGLAHPLLPSDRAVRNPVAVGGDTGVSLLVVSGSNMSGKSTLLRAVGVNVALALAGGPVRAGRLALTPVRLGATMRVQDSLADGKSRFFAEVTRVRDVLTLAGSEPPVLFLFDELFAGTNSADRLAGAEAVLRTLLARGAVGFVTTHDLALTAAVGRLGGRAVNVHLEDQIGPDGGLSFDYTVRPGVVPHGNGVALMRAVGLEV